MQQDESRTSDRRDENGIVVEAFLKLSERRPFGALTAPSGGETFASTNGGGNHAHINCNYCSCWSLLARGMLPRVSRRKGRRRSGAARASRSKRRAGRSRAARRKGRARPPGATRATRAARR